MEYSPRRMYSRQELSEAQRPKMAMLPRLMPRANSSEAAPLRNEWDVKATSLKPRKAKAAARRTRMV
eukprot:5536337-Lingulodinium_polyedra.AAC.1